MSTKTIDLKSIVFYQDADILLNAISLNKEYQTKYTDILAHAIRAKDPSIQARIFHALQTSMTDEELQKTATALDFFGCKYDTVEDKFPTDENALEHLHDKENTAEKNLGKRKPKKFIRVWAGYFLKMKDRIFAPTIKMDKEEFQKEEILTHLEEEELKKRLKEKKTRKHEEDRQRKMLIELWEEEEKRKKATKIRKKEHPKHFNFFNDNTRQ